MLTLTCFMVLSWAVYAQKYDYKVYRNRNDVPILSCQLIDSLLVLETMRKLEELDASLFYKNLHFYYRDLGWSYYRLYLLQKDTPLIHKSIDCYKKVVSQKRKDSSALWHLSFCYYLLGDCI